MDSEPLDTMYDSVPVVDGNQFAGTGVGQPGYGQPAELNSQPDAKAQDLADPNADNNANPEASPEQAQVSPEAYSFENASEYDRAVLQSFEEAAREHNLTQDAAQGLLNKVAPVLAQRQAERFAEIKEAWAKESMEDKELSNGGNERLFRENMAQAKRGLEAVDSDRSIAAILDQTGLGNHPAVLKMFMKIGKTISEDGFVSGRSGASNSTRSAAEILYDSSSLNSGN